MPGWVDSKGRPYNRRDPLRLYDDLETSSRRVVQPTQPIVYQQNYYIPAATVPLKISQPSRQKESTTTVTKSVNQTTTLSSSNPKRKISFADYKKHYGLKRKTTDERTKTSQIKVVKKEENNLLTFQNLTEYLNSFKQPTPASTTTTVATTTVIKRGVKRKRADDEEHHADEDWDVGWKKSRCYGMK